MNTGNFSKDALHFARQVLSNQVARFAPEIYANLTRKTGRGDSVTEPLQMVYYFLECFRDYQEQLDLPGDAVADYLQGKNILEYGPGDTLCMALLLYAHGASRVDCVDRFPLSRLTANNIGAYYHLLNTLPAGPRERAQSAFKHKNLVSSGFNPAAITYRVTPDGLAGNGGSYDLILSRAVLEHVNDLEETMRDIKRNLKPGGLSIHKVDLKSHGLDRHADFDFLTRRPLVYRLMYSHKGCPNRWRVNKYRELAEKVGLRLRALTPTGRLEADKVKRVYPEAARHFGDISPDEFSWLGFWMTLEHA